MAERRDFTFLSKDGHTQIHAREWTPDAEPKAVVQLIHGIAEHIERYNDFAEFLTQHGYAVFAHDILGHGKSIATDADLGYFAENDGWFVNVEDVHSLRRIAQDKYAGKPYFMLGHSMGSFLLRTYITLYADGLAGVIISGTGTNPEIALKIGRAYAALEMKRGKRVKSEGLRKLCFGSYNKRIENPSNENAWLSRDESVSLAYNSDPLCGFLPGAVTYYEMFRGISYLQKKENIAKIPMDLPMFFMSGDEDPVGAYGKGVFAAFKSYATHIREPIQYKLYHGGRHEMLNETNRADVYEDIVKWLDKLV